MFTFEELLSIAVAILGSLIVAYFVRRLERKYDLQCFIIGNFLCVIFFLLIWLFPQQLSSLIQSLFIAELTLALVWVELSKRPELKFLECIPIIHDRIGTGHRRADTHGQLSEPSTFLRIREATFPNIDLNFSTEFSFAVDLSNIGYQEIMVHEYVVYIDGQRQKPIPLGTQTNLERLRLITQGRYPINIFPLYIRTSGLHKIKIEALATTTKCSREVWLHISEDYKKLRYTEMFPLKRLLSPLVKAKLKDP